MKKKTGCLVAIIVVIVIIAVPIIVFNSAVSLLNNTSNEQQLNNDKENTQNVSNDDENTQIASNNEVSDTATTEKTEKYYNIGDTITIDEWELTLNSFDITDKITDDSGYMSYKPDEGNKYIVVNATVKNLSTSRDEFLPSISTGRDIRVKIKYKEYEFTSSTFLGESKDLHMTSLNPLSSKTGIIAFNVANEAVESLSELKLVFSTNKENYTFLFE